jgi:hypothetical protein
MPTTVEIRSSWAVQDAIDQQEARIHLASLLTPGVRKNSTIDKPIARAGMRPGFGGPIPGQVTPIGVAQIQVTPFQLFLPSRRAGNADGVYIVTSDQIVTLDVPMTPVDPINGRVDLLIVQQNDTFHGPDPDCKAVLKVISGIASGNPQPNTGAIGPQDWFEIGRWTVPKGVSSLQGTGVTFQLAADRFTVAAGGVLPVDSTASRDLLADAGWSGMPVYNRQSKALEILDKSVSPPVWSRMLADTPAITVTWGSTSASLVPIKVVGTLYRFGNDLYVWTGPTGFMPRLTWNDTVDFARWRACTLGKDVFVRQSGQEVVARQISANTAVVLGMVSRKDLSTGHTIDFTPGGTLVCQLPPNCRPKRFQTVSCTGEAVSTTGVNCTTGKIEIRTNGEMWFFSSTGYHPAWLSLDNIHIQLDLPVPS